MENSSPSKARVGVLMASITLAVAAGVAWWMHARQFESTDNAYVRGDITAIIPAVSGEIVRMSVAENQAVKAGQVLLEVDSAPYQARLAQASAMVRVRESALVSLDHQLRLQDSLIKEAEAGVAVAETERDRVGKELQRVTKLDTRGYANQQGVDSSRAALSTADSGVQRAEASLAAARQQKLTLAADRPRMEAERDAALAAERLARIDLENTVLRAPVDGIAADLVARKGLRVREGSRLLTLVPLSGLWVEANFKETQMQHMRPGQKVEVRVDAYPDQPLQGRIESFAPASGSEFALIPVENASGNFAKVVQRVPVRIALPAESPLAGLLRPGLSVVVDVDTRAE